MMQRRRLEESGFPNELGADTSDPSDKRRLTSAAFPLKCYGGRNTIIFSLLVIVALITIVTWNISNLHPITTELVLNGEISPDAQETNTSYPFPLDLNSSDDDPSKVLEYYPVLESTLPMEVVKNDPIENKNDTQLNMVEPWAPIGDDPPNSLPRTDRSIYIYLTWPFAADNLTLHNYRALESLLHVYSNANHVRFLVPGPYYASLNRWANALSFTHFQKYNKRGYHIEILLYFGGHNNLVREKSSLSGLHLPGSHWWDQYKDTKFYAKGMPTSKFFTVADALPDYSTVIFMACIELYKTGGIYGDLTLFHVAPIPEGVDGFVAGGIGDGNDVVDYDCSSPTSRDRRHLPLLMQWSKPKHPVLECVLRAYDDRQSLLNQCLDKDGGLSPGFSTAVDSGLSCALRMFDTCFDRLGLTNQLAALMPVHWRKCISDLDDIVLESDEAEETARLALDTMIHPSNNGSEVVKGESKFAFWLGKGGSDGVWKEPRRGSWAREAFSRLRLTRWAVEHVDQRCRTKCNRYHLGSRESEESIQKANFQCSPTVFVPGVQKGASTFLFHAITWHPQVIQPLRGSQGYKETGRYLSEIGRGEDKAGLRMAAFPFIESHENFITGDGTVTYMLSSPSVPELIKADNPDAKIVFALRNPTERAWSDYRFLFHIYGQRKMSFGKAIENSMEHITQCFSGLPEGSEEDIEGIKRFYNFRCSGSRNDPGSLIRKGIYYYQVLHWINIFGKENIMIVDSEDLRLRADTTVQKVYAFLGLCPTDTSKLTPENVTVQNNIAKELQIDAETYERLQKFFEPFNKKLYNLIGRDLGWELTSFRESKS